MTTIKIFFRNTLVLVFVFFLSSCFATNVPSEMILVGSTPGDEAIKSMLLIPADTKVEFMRWHLLLDDKNAFILEITFGESQPNTLGFKGGGEKRTINGQFTVSKSEGNRPFKEVYDLKSNNLGGKVSLVKLTENIFHILTSQNQLMNGNGGWGYSLFRKSPVATNGVLISSITMSSEKPLQLIFDGRTPCQEIAAEHAEMKVSQACFKLKWRLILNRDSVTYLPSTYSIRKVVDGQARNVTGKWSIIKGTPKNPDAVIYKIESDKPDESISFLVGDDNVLFFLNKNDEPYLGNENFGFTMNKKM